MTTMQERRHTPTKPHPSSPIEAPTMTTTIVTWTTKRVLTGILVALFCCGFVQHCMTSREELNRIRAMVATSQDTISADSVGSVGSTTHREVMATTGTGSLNRTDDTAATTSKEGDAAMTTLKEADTETDTAVSPKEAATETDTAVSPKAVEEDIKATAQTTQQQQPTVGLSIVHCNEPEQIMSWLDEIPSNWRVTIYETCGQNISAYSRPFKNAGSEECTGYLQTMIENYHNLPDINIFFQSDGLLGRGRPNKRYGRQHTPFKTIQELYNATLEFSPTWDGSKFLHYGPKELTIQDVNDNNTNYIYHHPKEIFEIMQLPLEPNKKTYSSTRMGACFAVSRERIQWKPVETYQALQESILQLHPPMARKRCCALENTWHAVMGEPYRLPSSHTVDHLWQAGLNRYEGSWAEYQEKLQRQKE